VEDRATTRPAIEALTLEELVARVNANNAKLPSLWSRGTFEALLKESADEPGRFLNGQIFAQHLKPGRVRLKAEKDAFGDVLDLGTDGTNLWLRLPTEGRLFVGTEGNLDPQKTAGLPLRPDLVLDVLGVNLLPTELAAWPAPTLRVDTQGGRYMVAYVEPARAGTPRLTIQREVWYRMPTEPGGTPLPVRVIANDDDGRPVLSATLENHEPVGDADGPLVATRLLLFFPQTGGKMRIELEDLRPRRGRLPAQRTFTFDASRYPEPVVSLDR
jgi:hypothetical protein